MTKEQQALAEKYAGYWMTKIDEDYPVPFHPEAFDPTIYELIPPGHNKPIPKRDPVVRQSRGKNAKPEPAIESTAVQVEDVSIGDLSDDISFSDEDL